MLMSKLAAVKQIHPLFAVSNILAWDRTSNSGVVDKNCASNAVGHGLGRGVEMSASPLSLSGKKM